MADDDNLATARRFGFSVVERDNRWLGRRFNDGYRQAKREGYDFVFAVGSDMWLHPVVFEDLRDLPPNTWEMHRHYSVVDPTGSRRADLHLSNPSGCLRTMPVDSLARLNWRPCRDYIDSGCDSATWARMRRHVTTREHDCRPFEMVGFQSPAVQISRYDKLHRRWAVREAVGDVFEVLADLYPRELVHRTRTHYLDRSPTPT